MTPVRWIIAAIVGLSVGVASPALGWGAKGHRLIATDAWGNLSQQTKDAIAELIGPGEEAFIAASTWPDEVRPQRRETAPWHYVNVPLSADGYDAKRDCPTGRCIIAKIPELMRAAADKTSSLDQRAEALKFVIHLAGDLFQTFHVGDNNDRGGNDTWVQLPDGRAVRLHEFWDVTVLEGATSVVQRAIALIFDLSSEGHRARAVEAWARESHKLAKQFAPALRPDHQGDGSRQSPYLLSTGYVDAAHSAAQTQRFYASRWLPAVLAAIFQPAAQ